MVVGGQKLIKIKEEATKLDQMVMMSFGTFTYWLEELRLFKVKLLRLTMHRTKLRWGKFVGKFVDQIGLGLFYTYVNF